MTSSRLSGPLQIIEHPESLEIATESGLVAIAYLYFEADPTRRTEARRMTPEEAWTVARKIAAIEL